MDFLTSKVTTILIIINIVIFLLETKDGGSTNRDVALKYGAQYQPLVRALGYWSRSGLRVRTCDLSDRIPGSGSFGKYSDDDPRREEGKQQPVGGSFRVYLRAFRGVLCARHRRVRLFDAQYFDNAGDQPYIRTVIEAD